VDSAAPTDNPSTGTTDTTTGPTDPTTTPTDPTTEPTDPTTEPTDPTTGPTNPVDDIAFDSTPPANPAIGGEYTVSAHGGSGGSIRFSVGKATTNDACSLSGPIVRFDHAGTCEIVAGDPGSSDTKRAAHAKSASQTIVIPKNQQTVTFDTDAPTQAAVDGTYVADASATSERDVTLSVGSDTTRDACSVSGSTVSFGHAGICQVIASQDGDADLDAASASQTFEVAKGSQAIDLQPAAPETVVVGDSYDFTATGGRSGNDVEVSTNNGDVCAVAGSSISFLAPGDCVISATQTGNGDYDTAPTVTQSVNVVATPPESDLTVSAEMTGEDQNWTYFRATVHNLPDFNRATVTVTPEGNYALTPVNGDCDKIGAASYVCTVTADVPHVDFKVNVHSDGRIIDFLVAPVRPLIDSTPFDNTAQLKLDD
jgi:hypothetical protein